MRFKWDPRKAATNQRVHGISLEVAQEVSEDPNHVVADNYFFASDGEQRQWRRAGHEHAAAEAAGPMAEEFLRYETEKGSRL